MQFSTSFLLHLPAHPVCRQTPPTLFRQRTYVSDSRSRFVKVGEGDAQSTSVADIFREGSVCWSAACASFTRGHTTCCCRDTTWCSLVETCLLLRSERGWLCCLMISFSQVVLKVHINKRLSNRWLHTKRTAYFFAGVLVRKAYVISGHQIACKIASFRLSNQFHMPHSPPVVGTDQDNRQWENCFMHIK